MDDGLDVVKIPYASQGLCHLKKARRCRLSEFSADVMAALRQRDCCCCNKDARLLHLQQRSVVHGGHAPARAAAVPRRQSTAIGRRPATAGLVASCAALQRQLAR